MDRTETIAAAIANARRMNDGYGPTDDPLAELHFMERERIRMEARWVEKKLAEFDAERRDWANG